MRFLYKLSEIIFIKHMAQCLQLMSVSCYNHGIPFWMQIFRWISTLVAYKWLNVATPHFICEFIFGNDC